VKRGDVDDVLGTDTDDPILQSESQYYVRTYTPYVSGAVESAAYPIASESVYPDAIEGSSGDAQDDGLFVHLAARHRRYRNAARRVNDGRSGRS